MVENHPDGIRTWPKPPDVPGSCKLMPTPMNGHVAACEAITLMNSRKPLDERMLEDSQSV